MVRYRNVINGLREKTEITPQDNPIRELWKMLLRFLGYTVVICGIGVYLVLYLIFYVVGASWRGNRV
jgi:hypothetical protein